MATRIQRSAYDFHIGTMRDVLSCVTEFQITGHGSARFAAALPYTVALNRLSSVPLRGETRLHFVVAQTIRIMRTAPTDDREPYTVTIIRYTYALETGDGKDAIAFHWTPDTDDPGAVTFEHLHIGPALIGPRPMFRPGDRHEAHIPTAHVSLAAVIRMAIAEFAVAPIRDDWRAVLNRTETARYA